MLALRHCFATFVRLWFVFLCFAPVVFTALTNIAMQHLVCLTYRRWQIVLRYNTPNCISAVSAAVTCRSKHPHINIPIAMQKPPLMIGRVRPDLD